MIKIAVLQFGNQDDRVLEKLAKSYDMDWYYFEEDADREFETEALKPFYDYVLEYKS